MEIELLGPPRVRDGAVEREVAGRQGALLAALALRAGGSVSTDRLIDVVWGNEPPRDAVNALQQRISRLRALLDPARTGHVLMQSSGAYMLTDEVQTDVRRFEDLAGEGRRLLAGGNAAAAEEALSEALALWRGRALGSFADELWAVTECRRLEELRLSAAEDRGEALIRLRDHGRVVRELGDLAAAHPLRERLGGLIMQALYAAGRQAEALGAYERTRRLLVSELGVDPSPELQRLHQQILVQHDELDAGSASQSPARAGNLPAPQRSIVGRETGLAQITRLLSHSRLLTITGTGGVGKTTLAVEAARHHDSPPDGTWLVELAPIATGDALVPAIAEVLGVTGGGLGSTAVDAAALLRVLARRRALLVLDNCEHLLDAVSPLVEQVLREAPAVQVLATSREPLGVAGEVLWSVPGLGVPDADDATVAQIAAAPAVRLLVERARAHTPAFGLDDDSAPAAATLVHRLDGIPLAIELAAARLRVLSLTELVDALDDRFRMLTGRGRTGASRHRTLRAALDWSWELLDEPLQRSWAALAVPAHGFDLASATRLLAGAGLDVDAVDTVADLVDRSLLIAETSTTPTRYRMLESLRHYGRQRLGEQGLDDAVGAAHAELVEEALAACNAGSSPERFLVDIDGLARWLDDARVVLRWADERGDRRRVQRLAGLLGWLWLLRGRSAEGLAWLDRGLPAPERVDAGDDVAAIFWASALRAAGIRAADGHRWADVAVGAAVTPVDRVLAQVCAAGHDANAGRPADAARRLEACDAEAQQLGGWPLGFVRLIGGQLAWVGGDLRQARLLTGEALELLSAAGADWAHVHAVETLIDEAAARGDHHRASDLAREGLRLCRRQGYPELEAAMLTKLGRTLAESEEPEHAARLLDEAVRRATSIGSTSALADAHTAAGAAARRRGDLETATRHLHQAERHVSDLEAVPEAVQLHVEIAYARAEADQGHIAIAHARTALHLACRLGDPRTLQRCLEALAAAMTAAGDLGTAVTVLATTDALGEAATLPPPPSRRHDVDTTLERLRARVDTETFAATWAAARQRAAARPEQVVAQLVAAHAGQAPHGG